MLIRSHWPIGTKMIDPSSADSQQAYITWALTTWITVMDPGLLLAALDRIEPSSRTAERI